MFYNIPFIFVFCSVFLFSILCIRFLYCFCIVLSIISPFVLPLFYFYTRLLTTATGWKPNCNK